MPQAVTHILIPIILLSLFRDFIVKDKKKFPLHYVLIGGIAGILPDLDLLAYYILGFFGFTLNELHRTFSHNLFFVLLFVLLGLLFIGTKNKELGKHHLKLGTIFFVIGFGAFIHLLLDALIVGEIVLFYPFSSYAIGLNLFRIFPDFWQGTLMASLDAGLLIVWLIYMEVKHKISDFI